MNIEEYKKSVKQMLVYDKGRRKSMNEQGYTREGYKAIETSIIDRLINITTGEEQIIDQGHNLIVVHFGWTVASLLKNDGTYGIGIQYLAVGEGEGTSWDSLTNAERQALSTFDLTQLYDEIARVSTSGGIIWIDENDDPSITPTNRIEVTVTLTDAITGSLREFGLFAGIATGVANSGFMINHKTHTKIDFNLDSAFSQVLVRTIRLTL